MQGTIKILNSRGHSTVEYDTETGVVEEAEGILRDAARANSVLFDAKTREKIEGGPGKGRSVLEEHEEILVVPPMAGG